MIKARNIKAYCNEDISLIENYDEAINSMEVYDCHHKLETELNKTKQDLIDLGLYWNRPASELIFLTHSEHAKIHMSINAPYKGKHLSKDTKQKMSIANKSKTPWIKGKKKVWNESHTSFHFE